MNADMRKVIYSNDIMSRRNELIIILLSGLTDSELENLVRVREEAHPIPALRRPVPTTRKMGVKQLTGILRIIPFHHIDRFHPPE